MHCDLLYLVMFTKILFLTKRFKLKFILFRKFSRIQNFTSHQHKKTSKKFTLLKDYGIIETFHEINLQY